MSTIVYGLSSRKDNGMELHMAIEVTGLTEEELRSCKSLTIIDL